MIEAIGRFLCTMGFHKWDAIGGTIRRIDKYTVGADLYCTRNCGAIGYGTKDKDY